MLHHSHNMKAFSLIEMLVVIAITSTVMVSLGFMISFFYKTNGYVLESASATNSARRGTSIALSQLREASYADDGSYPLSNAATSTLTFYADTDNDSAVERVRLYLLNGTFYEGVTNTTGSPPSYAGQPEATTTLALNVRNTAATPIFQYYDSSGTLLTGTINLSLVRSIKMTLYVDVNPNRAPNVYTLAGSATLRNLDNR
jgi:prepilin-type N-terminal cleavage/methylation domain-containing protein